MSELPHVGMDSIQPLWGA